MMKLPNGFGNVSLLPGKRRKPWRARVTTGWKNDPDTHRSVQLYKAIGYYETREDAIAALVEYARNPLMLESNVTFAEVYDRWSTERFPKISEVNANGYRTAFKTCTPLHNAKFADLKLPHLQEMIDRSGKNYSSLKKIKILLNQMYEYAIMHEIIPPDRNRVEYLNIGDPVKSEKHFRFTEAEVNTMWEWSENNEYIQVILMLIYSGVRPGELFALKKSDVNMDELWFFIEKGKNNNATRKVPIHHRTEPFFRHWMSKPGEYLVTKPNGDPIKFVKNHVQYVDLFWKPLLLDMGIYRYKNDKGNMMDHTPDDTRHTFTTMWKEKKLDEAMRRRIQGHAGEGIGEQVYTHLDLEILRSELDKL